MMQTEQTVKEAGGLPLLNKRVLVVDDEQYIRDILEMFFSSCACEVDVGVNGAEGLQMSMAKEYDIVISDIRMPHMTGLEFYDALLIAKPAFDGHFVFISGELDRLDCRKMVEATRRPFLTKPFLPSDILGFVA